jgi:hypothetical protein
MHSHAKREGHEIMTDAKLVIPALATILAVVPAHAQVTVDVSKITCNQYLSFNVADPRDIAIWLSGYYHGKRSSTVLETQELKQNAEKLRTACFLKENSELPIMQVIEKGMGGGK